MPSYVLFDNHYDQFWCNGILNFDNHGLIVNYAFLLCLARRYVHVYRGADKSLARPTYRCILFYDENISFDASLVTYAHTHTYIYIYIVLISSNYVYK